eukprot:213871_1
MMRRRCGPPVVVVPRRRCGLGLMGTAMVASAAASRTTKRGAQKRAQQEQQQQIYYQQKEIEKLKAQQKAQQKANTQPKVIYIQQPLPQQVQYAPPQQHLHTIEQQHVIQNEIEGMPQPIPSAPPIEYTPIPIKQSTQPLTTQQYQYVQPQPKPKTKIVYVEKPKTIYVEKQHVKETPVEISYDKEKEQDKGCAVCIIL